MRYPIADLIAMMRCDSEDQARRTLRIGAQYHRIVDEGLTLDQAERYAERAGFHPYEVWPAMRDDVIDDTLGVQSVRVLHAFVTCLECGRPLEFDDVKVDGSGASGRVEAVCRVGHRNTLRVELEVA